MKKSNHRVALGVIASVGLAAAALVISPGHVHAATPTYSVNPVGTAYGGEPSITSDSRGFLYEDTPSQGLQMYISQNGGQGWSKAPANPDNSSGDNCLGTDQENAVYQCNLNGSDSVAPLQAAVWKTTDLGATWQYGTNPINLGGPGGNNACGGSCSVFGVDRQWTDAYIAPGQHTNQALVALMYHDFYGPSHIWVNLSNDGGQTYSAPEDILANLNPSAVTAQVIADTACSSVPAAVRIAKGGPHPGRIYAAWIASDPTAFPTGCNISMVQAFHNLIIAYADPPFSIPTAPTVPTIKFTPVIAFDAGEFHDSSTPFVGFTLDNQGNPYFGFANNFHWDATCSGPLNPQTPNCEYDMYVVWSPDGGTTWTGGNGLPLLGGGTPFKVNTDTGTHFFPAIAASDPGHVWVSWLRTGTIIPTDPNGKEHPGSCFAPQGGTCTFTDTWKLFGAQSANLLLGNGSANPNPTWADTTTPITPNPMHQGDICNLGIACVPTVSNRNLLDFISETVDPQGCAHIAFADDKTNNILESANQITGCVAPLAANVPEAPIALLFAPVGLGVAIAVGWRTRRRRRNAVTA